MVRLISTMGNMGNLISQSTLVTNMRIGRKFDMSRLLKNIEFFWADLRPEDRLTVVVAGVLELTLLGFFVCAFL